MPRLMVSPVVTVTNAAIVSTLAGVHVGRDPLSTTGEPQAAVPVRAGAPVTRVSWSCSLVLCQVVGTPAGSVAAQPGRGEQHGQAEPLREHKLDR
jgi:hypothetical protein